MSESVYEFPDAKNIEIRKPLASRLPGFHAARLRSGLIVVRYAVEAPGARVHLYASNTDYQPLDESSSALVGRVRQMPGDGEGGEHWELLNPAVVPMLVVERLLGSLT